MGEMGENNLDRRKKKELELNVVSEMEGVVCVVSHKSINSHIWKDFEWKTKMRYFRDCGLVADHTHIFWACPVLRYYLQSING